MQTLYLPNLLQEVYYLRKSRGLDIHIKHGEILLRYNEAEKILTTVTREKITTVFTTRLHRKMRRANITRGFFLLFSNHLTQAPKTVSMQKPVSEMFNIAGNAPNFVFLVTQASEKVGTFGVLKHSSKIGHNYKLYSAPDNVGSSFSLGDFLLKNKETNQKWFLDMEKQLEFVCFIRTKIPRNTRKIS
ncbi:hypothetical protein CDAR_613531 [Caerostris darwini]|uniref:Uncharacterized protein n=1 Tax=Caerostris darwini TaxID=1538125 RepID=A0AAV4RSZ6_9ARAC|nr:hypothetical protein CDAR_613531 [Caerostris darwini]